VGPGTFPQRARPARNAKDELENVEGQKGNDIMDKIRLRLTPTLFIGAVSCLAVMSHACTGAGAARNPVPAAATTVPAATAGRPDTRRTEFPAQFVARAISVSSPEDVGPIEIYVERWSTDDELGKLLGTLKEGGPGELITVLERQRVRAGVVLMPGVQGHGERVRIRTPKNFQFAREIITPAGRQVILASDERLGLGETQLDARKEIYEFSLMDIRFGPDGTGVGKVAAAGDVVYNPETKILELKDYETRPVRLVNVKSAKP